MEKLLNPLELLIQIEKRLERIEKVIEKIDLLIEQPNPKLKLTPRRFFTTDEVCGILHISKVTLQSYRNHGLIDFTRVGHKVLFKEEDIDCFLEQNKSRRFRNIRKILI